MSLHCRIQHACLLPACAAVAIALAGCSNQTELLLPEGAFTPENKTYIPAGNASPEPGIGVQNPAGSASIGGTMNLEADVDIQPAPAPAPVPAAPVPPPAAVQSKAPQNTAKADITYKVRKGDTLSAVAKQYNLHWRVLADYNDLDGKARIYPGRTLRIPVDAGQKNVPAPAAKAADAGKIHIVKKGEFPAKIAAMYKVKLDDLVALNNLKGKKTIYVGQKLRIPQTAAVAATATVTAKKSVAKKPVAKKTAAKKPTAKKTAAQKTVTKVQPAKKSAAKKTQDVPVIKNEPKKDLAQNANNNDNSVVTTETASVPVKTSSSVAVAPVKENKDVASDMPTLEMKLDKDMTLEQVAQAFDRSIDTLKKYNPSLKSGEVLKADTVIIVPIF